MINYIIRFYLILACMFPAISFAMDTEIPDETALELRDVDAHQHWLLLFAESAANLPSNTYVRLIDTLSKKITPQPYYAELVKALSQSKKTAKGLELKFWDNSFLSKTPPHLLFHGSQATLEILDSGELKGFTAKCGGWGIFFGRNFIDSYSYSKPYSSNIHHTYKKIVSSVLILKKDPYLNFEASNAGLGGTVKQYLLKKERYSLTNLVALFLDDETHLEEIENLLISKSLHNVVVYIDTYHPLKEPAHLSALQSILCTHHNALLKDSFFLACFANFFPAYFFKNDHIANQVLKSLTMIEKHDLHTLLKAATIAKSYSTADTLQRYSDPHNFLAGDTNSLFATTLEDVELEGLQKNLHYLAPVLPEAARILEQLADCLLPILDHKKLSLLATTFKEFPHVQKIVLYALLEQKRLDPTISCTVFLNALPTLKAHNTEENFIATMAAQSGNYELLGIIAQHAPELIACVDRDGKNVLHHLAKKPDAIVIFNDMLAVAPQMIEGIDRFKNSIAHVAVEYNNLEVLKVIVQETPDLIKANFKNIMERIDIHRFTECREIIKTHFPAEYEAYIKL